MPRPHAIRSGQRLLLLVAAWAAFTTLTPSIAAAHSRLTASTPSDGATLTQAPDRIELRFSGHVTVEHGSVQVFAPDGSHVERGKPFSAESSLTVVQHVDADVPGTYGVAYRVSSGDGHVVTGAISFSVGASDDDGTSDAAVRTATHVDRGVQSAFSITRMIEISALLIAAGGGLFACLIAPGWQPRGVLPALVVLLISYAASYVFNAALAHGNGFEHLFDHGALRASWNTPFALSVRIRALVALVALAAALAFKVVPDRLTVVARCTLAAVFMALAATLSITGHAVTTAPLQLRLPLDMLHVCAAAVWIGGLVQLWRLAPTASNHVPWVVRFSRVAMTAVVVILITGAYAAYAELGVHLGELTSSRYGRLVLAKFVLYAATMPLAWNNMSAFVPALRARPDDAPHMLRQYVWRELALLVVVIGLTVWLIATPQPH
ncbi:MAG: copper resistance protein CopC [Thermoleophilia bacterium]|nr:copper resistance protein CopC [Thermoleophilia bacterium]